MTKLYIKNYNNELNAHCTLMYIIMTCMPPRNEQNCVALEGIIADYLRKVSDAVFFYFQPGEALIPRAVKGEGWQRGGLCHIGIHFTILLCTRQVFAFDQSFYALFDDNWTR